MPKTLIIDDDPEFEAHIREHFGAGLENPAHHQFVFAHNKAEALSIMAEVDDIDIAAVTIDNPAIGGMSIFRELTGLSLIHI